MGLRGFSGFQAQVRKNARAQINLRKRPRVMPWDRRGMSRVAKVIAFLEFLPITKGKLTGRKLKLLPSQRAFIQDLYGRAESERVRLGIFSEPRGNGKTG